MKERAQTHKGRSLTALVLLVFVGLFSAGCDSLRFAPNQQQKQNAYLHNRTTALAAAAAQEEDASAELQGLAELSELQSRSFTGYFGLPEELPAAESAEDILRQENRQLAIAALADSEQRPDPWDLADLMLELGIGISAVLGGVYGAKTAKFLKGAQAKSKALKEIITGNELFKKLNPTQTEGFKRAHANQSPQTRQIVTQAKAG